LFFHENPQKQLDAKVLNSSHNVIFLIYFELSKYLALIICLEQWSLTFFVQSPPTATLLKNHPPFMNFFVLSKIIFYFENNSISMKYKQVI